MNFEEQAVYDANKLDLVILSCKTEQQLLSAFKYFMLWERKYNHSLKEGSSSPYRVGFAYRAGKAVGIFNGMKIMLCREKNM